MGAPDATLTRNRVRDLQDIIISDSHRGTKRRRSPQHPCRPINGVGTNNKDTLNRLGRIDCEINSRGIGD